MPASRDVVIIGGGHNGLVAAAYLARAGLSTLVCERRDIVGGAAVSEHPFGPDYTVTSLSYVVSLLPRIWCATCGWCGTATTSIRRGRTSRRAPTAATSRLPHDPAQRHAEIAKFSARDAATYAATRRTWRGIGAILGPMLSEIPPRLGSRRPQDLLRQGLLLRHLRNVDTRAAVDITRLLTSSIADLLDDYFESDALRGLLSVSGVIGTWAGPRSAGSAYVTLHHHLGDAGGQAGRLGLPARRHGRRDGGAGRGRPVVRCRDPHRGRGRGDQHQRRPGDRRDAGERRGDRRGHRHHHRAPEDLVPGAARPGRAAGGLPRRHPRLAVAQRHGQDQPGGRPAAGLRQPSRLRPAGPRRHDRAGREPGRHRERLPGRGRRASRAGCRSPTSAFRACSTTAWRRPASTWCRCSPSGCRTRTPTSPTRPPWPPTPTASSPAWRPSRRASPSSVLHRQVIGPHQMQEEYGLVGGNIFHGELTLGQMFHARPAAGYADLRTPVRGLYQAGSATHGGGGVTGIPGRNVVHQVLADRRAARWRRAGRSRLAPRRHRRPSAAQIASVRAQSGRPARDLRPRSSSRPRAKPRRRPPPRPRPVAAGRGR